MKYSLTETSSVDLQVYAERHRRKEATAAIALFSLMAFMGAVVWMNYYAAVACWPSFWGLVMVVMYHQRKYDLIQREIFTRLGDVPLQKRLNSLAFYGSGLPALECEESHLPGDCPLCGAE